MKNFLRFVGIDKAVGFTLLSRGWTAISGFITLYLIAKWLTPEEQGFYYTFSSVLALQVIFELGLSFVVMQFSSHEMATMKFTSKGVLNGDAVAKSRLRSLLLLVLKWYGAISLLIILIILPLGWAFFTINQDKSTVIWQSSWCLLIISAALNVLIIPLISMLEGCGKVVEVAKLRVTQGVLGNTLMWILLMSGRGLNSAPLMNVFVFFIALFWLWSNYRYFLRDLISSQIMNARISWKDEIWPFQWRVALSWLSGYLMLQLFVPILFSASGPIAAGKMGLSLSITLSILSVSIAWVNTKAPLFGNLVALKKYDQLDTVFFIALRQSTFVIILGALCVFLINSFLIYTNNPLTDRLLPILPFLLLLLSTIINNVVFAESIYLRAFKDEGFMWVYILLGLFVSIGSLLIGPRFGALGMMSFYFFISLIIGLGLGRVVFEKKRNFLQKS
ncbi:MAG: hypothetical protein RIQ94_2316 [Pseudomonadota bacterium]